MRRWDLKWWIDASTFARRCSRRNDEGPRGRLYNGVSMIRRFIVLLVAAPLAGLSGCGYHTLGAATHLPPGVHTLAVPEFATHTEAYHTETVMTDAVIREFAARTRFRVTPEDNGDADAVLHGTILTQIVAPLTYNSATQQSSSFLITLVVSVTLTGRDGKILYQNKNYVYRQQYQSTADLPTFFEENPAAVQRMSREFARALVADVLEGF
jgi:outer membrane lipopolysaccharide assembly protein LptE/RlpB